jgi:hypothetical protein
MTAQLSESRRRFCLRTHLRRERRGDAPSGAGPPGKQHSGRHVTGDDDAGAAHGAVGWAGWQRWHENLADGSVYP